MQTPGDRKNQHNNKQQQQQPKDRFYSIDDVSPDVESRQRKKSTPPQAGLKRYLNGVTIATATANKPHANAFTGYPPSPLSPSAANNNNNNNNNACCCPSITRSPQCVRVAACGVFFVLLVFGLAVALGVSVQSHSSNTSNNGDNDRAPASSGSLHQTSRPTVFQCPSADRLLQRLPDDAPTDFSVRLTMSDLCLNYPALDCYSTAPANSFTQLNGAELGTGGLLWYFADEIVFRVRQVGQLVEFRLEVVHAHDPERDTRAFVYTAYVREHDYCLVGFETKQVVAQLMDKGSAYCVADDQSSSREAAGRVSELVRRFAAKPTEFVSRKDGKWVFATETSKTQVTTAGGGSPVLLLGVPVTNNNRPAAFVVSAQRNTHPQVMAALENDYMLTSNADSPVCRTAQSSLAARSSLVFLRSAGDGSEDDQGCSLECDSNGGTLQQVIECVDACINGQLQEEARRQAATPRPAARLLRQRYHAHHTAAPAGDHHHHALPAKQQPKRALSSSLHETDSSLGLVVAVTTGDDRLLDCSTNQTTYTDDPERFPEQARLVAALQGLQDEVSRLESRLTRLIPLWNSAAAFNWNVVEPHRLAYYDVLDVRDRFLASINQVRAMKRTTALAEVKDAANAIHTEFSTKYTAWFDFWDEYFARVGGTVGLQQLNTVHLSQELLQLRRMLAALETYAVPIFSTTAARAGEESLLSGATLAMAEAKQQLARVQLDFYDVELIAADSHEALAQEAALKLMMEESDALVRVLNAELVGKLEPALSTKITQTFVVAAAAGTGTMRVPVAQAACEQLELACPPPTTCSLVSDNLVQVFQGNPPFTSANDCLAIDASSSSVCRNADCISNTGNYVLLPQVAVHTRRVDLSLVLQDPALAEQYSPMLLAALDRWPQFDTPQTQFDYAQLAVTNAETILQRLIAAYSPAQWLPSSCLSDQFDAGSAMLCPELAPATLSLHLCEVTLQPTQSVVPTTRSPGTQYPTTKSPTVVPTKRPTTARPSPPPTMPPTMAPTLEPTPLPTNKPTLPLPTRSPTLQPSMSPIAPFTCQWPPANKGGCPGITDQPGCDAFTGCIWDEGSNDCSTIADCSEFDCNIKLLTFIQGGRQLPGCRLGVLDQCESQRLRMFTALKLGTKCGLKFVKTSEGGAWMGKETSLPALPTTTTTQSGRVFVSSDEGNDVNGLGTRASPFRTLQRAVEQTRRFQASVQQRTIVVMGGEYRLSQALDFTQADSNLAIVGENHPRVSGAVSLSGLKWERWNSMGIVRAALPKQILDQVDTLSQLFVNDQAGVRARFPNLQNRLGFKYVSAATSVSAWATMGTIPAQTRVISKTMIPSDLTTLPANGKLQYAPMSIPYNKFSLGYGGLCSHFTHGASYFCDPEHYAQGGCRYTLPTGVTMKANQFNNFFSGFSAKSKNSVFFHTLHWWGWGLWTFTVNSMTAKRVTFGTGGWQEARGDCKKGGGDWYVENMLSMLDYPSEYFLDRDQGYIYYYPESEEDNPAFNPGGVKLELGTSVRTLFRFVGSRNVVIRGLDFFGTYPSLMDEHEVPGGGDWTLVRQAALVVENVEDVRVQECQFRKMGGNALLVSRHARRVFIERNEFHAMGSSAVMIVGDPAFDTSTPWIIHSFPSQITVFANVMSHFGLVVKQAAGVFVALSKEVDIVENVMHSSSRGGLVFNDGFGGGIRAARNTLFEHVLETNDHGIVNSWDRQQFEEPVGKKAPFVIEENLLLGTRKGPKGIDLDDGAFNYVSRNNVLVWGYQKFKGSNILATGNLILYPLESACVFITPQTRLPAVFDYSNNVCVSWKLGGYAYNMATPQLRQACAANNFASYNNTFYIGGLGAAPQFDGCSPGTKYSFTQWQTRYGQDARSVQYTRVPEYAQIETWVTDKLPWVAASNAVVQNRGGR